MKLIGPVLCAALVVGAAGVAHAAATVSINDFYFLPAKDTVRVGDVVTWENDGDATHTTTRSAGANLWDSGFIGPAGTFQHQFNSPGTFTYHCNVHPTLMNGTIVVLAVTPAKGATWSGLRKTYSKAGKVKVQRARK